MSRRAWSPREHAERGAGLEPERLDARDHLADLVEIAVLGLAPGRAHAEAARAGRLGGARLGEHRVDRHQLLGLDAGVVVHALRAIGAVLRAAAGLDRQQRRNLHFGRIEVQAVDASARGRSIRGTEAQTAPAPPARVQSWRMQRSVIRCGSHGLDGDGHCSPRHRSDAFVRRASHSPPVSSMATPSAARKMSTRTGSPRHRSRSSAPRRGRDRLPARNPSEHERAQHRDRVRRGRVEMPGDLAGRIEAGNGRAARAAPARGRRSRARRRCRRRRRRAARRGTAAR